jgi:hypothetical protein
MNLRRISTPITALLLAVGIVSVGVAPADAAAGPRTGSHTKPGDTGWGFK